MFKLSKFGKLVHNSWKLHRLAGYNHIIFSRSPRLTFSLQSFFFNIHFILFIQKTFNIVIDFIESLLWLNKFWKLCINFRNLLLYWNLIVFFILTFILWIFVSLNKSIEQMQNFLNHELSFLFLIYFWHLFVTQ